MENFSKSDLINEISVNQEMLYYNLKEGSTSFSTRAKLHSSRSEAKRSLESIFKRQGLQVQATKKSSGLIITENNQSNLTSYKLVTKSSKNRNYIVDINTKPTDYVAFQLSDRKSFALVDWSSIKSFSKNGKVVTFDSNKYFYIIPESFVEMSARQIVKA